MAATESRRDETEPAPRARRRRAVVAAETPRDRILRYALGVVALLPAAALVFLAYELFRSAWPSIVYNGGHFFTGKTFNIGNLYSYSAGVTRHGYEAAPGASFGVAPLIVGTLLCSLIALALAVPISVGAAILLVERMPKRLQGPLGVFLELLAGIPSVVFGLWGVFTFGPFIARDIYKPISALGIPGFRSGITANGTGLLTASLVLAVMIIPVIAATARELIRSVPGLTKEGAVALGLTSSESVRLVTLPFIRRGVIAATFLGWGRALGETIAVLFISGSIQNTYPKSAFGGFATMASTIASTLDSALTDSTKMAIHALAELGLVLLAVTLITNAAGRLIASRFGGGGLPVGRGV
jgi:phosphate transport system permease protein